VLFPETGREQHSADPIPGAVARWHRSFKTLNYRAGERGMQLRIYYEDTDAGGVVYHANYLGYFERGRTEFLRERGLSVAVLAEQGCIFPVVRLELDYRAPAFLDDLLRVETEVLTVGKTSFTLAQQVVRVIDDRLLAAGKVTLVCTSGTLKARRLPKELVRVLAE
jgi:acyl-CoA thioester hydrolase